ncbi:MAG: hypothetical protein KTR14_09135 [Vampirovibrio sp.]|nr:hypothetical protein [Vampirovibrio sp.]
MIRPAVLAAGVVTMAAPVGYLIKTHRDWMTTPDAKNRMLTRQLLFWGSVAVALPLMHITLFRWRQFPVWQRLVNLAMAAGIPVVAFEGGRPVSHVMFPKKFSTAHTYQLSVSGSYTPIRRSSPMMLQRLPLASKS